MSESGCLSADAGHDGSLSVVFESELGVECVDGLNFYHGTHDEFGRSTL